MNSSRFATQEREGWWRDGVLYQMYVRSFADSDGDGVGDLAGITAHLDHLQWLGVTGVWLSPVTVSPNADFGYDVADYCAVDPALGTLGDLDVLVDEAGRRGMRVLLDLVPNHTSDQHPWFVDARSSRTSAHRDWYVWAEVSSDGSPPNNWVSSFGGPAWTLDPGTGQWYLHNFLPEQPDLNWWNPEVRDEFERIVRFWFDRGVTGFRIDVAHALVKDRELRDNPPSTDADPLLDQIRGQRPIYNQSRPEVHEIYRRWRDIAQGYDPPRVLLGETFVLDVAEMASFYGAGDELDLAFNIPFLHAPFEAASLRAVIEVTEAAIPAGSQPVWNGSSHDLSRFPTRWCGGDAARTRLALMLLLTLRGSVVLYYGDDLGLPDTELTLEQVLDPATRRFWPYLRRDHARTPMPWTGEPGGGFTGAAVTPWLPFGDLGASNVVDQRRDPDSTLSLCRDLIGLRAAVPDLRHGRYASIPARDGVLAYHRGDRVVVALNLGDEPAAVDTGPGRIRICTSRARDEEHVDAALHLAPGEGAVVWCDQDA